MTNREEVEDCDGIVYLDKTRQVNRTEKGILRCCKEDDGCVLIKDEKTKIGWDFKKKRKFQPTLKLFDTSSLTG